jgi:hypothetical protein
MNWVSENAKDEQLVRKLGLGPLAVSGLVPGEGLGIHIELHNARLGRVEDLARRLIADRARLGDVDNWAAADGTALLAERDHLRHESWDFLQELRAVVQDRRDVLDQVATWLGELGGDLSHDHEQAEKSAANALAKERRETDRRTPATAAAHFNDLVANHESVREAAARCDAAQATFNEVNASRLHLSNGLSEILRRQRDLFQTLAQ